MKPVIPKTEQPPSPQLRDAVGQDLLSRLSPSRLAASPTAFSVLLLAAWLSLMVFPTRMPIPARDQSWMAVLNYAAIHHLQHGVDIVFTYGPLGYLAKYLYFEGTWMSVVAFQAISRAMYLALVWRIARAARGTLGTAKAPLYAFVSAAVVMPTQDWDSFYLLFITFAGVSLCTEAKKGSLELGAICLMAVVALIKGTFLAFVLVTIGCAVLWCILNRRKGWAILVPAVFLVAFAFSWRILARQAFTNLPVWLRWVAEITSGQQHAMVRVPHLNQLACGVLVTFIVTVWLVVALRRSRSLLPVVILLFCGMLLAWKQGFTRGDESHTRTFFAYILTVTLSIPLLLGAARSRALVVFVLGLTLGSILLCRLPFPLYHVFNNARFLVRLPRMAAIYAAHARLYELPEIRSLVGSSSVDVVAEGEHAIAILNGLNYRPAPVFQAYAAGTPRLARLNADYYRSERAPEFIIFREGTIDDRLPNLDNSLSGLIIAHRYRPVAAEQGYQLLRRVSANREILDPLSSGTVKVGDRLKVKGGDWCEIVMEENLMGQFIRLFWGSPPVYVRVWRGEGEVVYRFIPSLGRAGFVIPEGTVGMALCKSKATRLCFRPEISYRVCRLRGGGE